MAPRAPPIVQEKHKNKGARKGLFVICAYNETPTEGGLLLPACLLAFVPGGPVIHLFAVGFRGPVRRNREARDAHDLDDPSLAFALECFRQASDGHVVQAQPVASRPVPRSAGATFRSSSSSHGSVISNVWEEAACRRSCRKGGSICVFFLFFKLAMEGQKKKPPHTEKASGFWLLASLILEVILGLHYVLQQTICVASLLRRESRVLLGILHSG